VGSIPRSIFKAYDIRGIWGVELNAEVVRAIGYAIAEYVKDEGELIVGMDVRIHSPEMMRALVDGATKVGDVYVAGTATTPMMHHASRFFDRPAVMITASHNPPQYNGLKPMHSGGEDFTSEEIARLYDAANSPIPDGWRGVALGIDIRGPYFRYILDRFGQMEERVGFDPGNAAGVVLKPLLNALFRHVEVINGEPDGRFPAHLPDPEKAENLEQLRRLVVEKGLDAGIALDGDCDRVGLVARSGRIVRPEKMAYLLIETMAKPGDVVVLEVTMPLYLEEAAAEKGVKVIRARTGHTFQFHAAKSSNALFFAEYSGHIGFRENNYFDDGLYAALKVITLAREVGGLDALLDKSPKVYEERMDIPVEDREAAMARVRERVKTLSGVDQVVEIDGVDVRLRNGARVLVRPSNTEPLLRVKIEGRDEDAFKTAKETAARLLG